MAREGVVPSATEVMAQHAPGGTGGAGRDGVVMVDWEAVRPDHWQRRLWPNATCSHGGPPDTIAGPALSGLCWPIRSGVTTAAGWDAAGRGRRHDVGPVVKGRCLQRTVAEVSMRAGGCRSSLAGMGGRRAAWRREVRCQVTVRPSARDRWRDEGAEGLPRAEAISAARHRQPSRTEGHGEGYDPRGRSGQGVVVRRDAPGRIIATAAVEAAPAAQGTPRVRRLTASGLPLKPVARAHRPARRQASPAVYPEARIPDDDVQLRQHSWPQRWRHALAHRRAVAARRQQVRTRWDRDQLEALARTLGATRSRRMQSDERMSPQAQPPLVAILEADPKGGMLRTCRKGGWHIGRDSRDAQEARDALKALQKSTLEPKAPGPLEKVCACLEEHVDAMSTSRTHEEVHRTSRAESGMRVLRRLEVEPDGFRTLKGREHCLRIYQAVQDLGWSVHHPNCTSVG